MKQNRKEILKTIFKLFLTRHYEDVSIILIVTLLVLLFFKWIVFALLALPLKVVLLMKKEKDAAKVAGRKTDLSVLGDPISGYKLSLIQQIKAKAASYIIGYLRYMDFQTGRIPS